jgi:hypothetical protein
VAANGGDPEAHRRRAAERGRNPAGKFTQDPETARRNAEACELRAKGWSYRKLAAHFDVDYKTIYDAVQDTLREITREPAEELRTLMLERLDAELVRLNGLEEAARQVLERHHVTVSNGQIVFLGGEPLIDDAPVLAAIDRLLKIDEQRRKNDESRRKLLGLDQPAKVEHSGGVRYELIGVDPQDLV